MEDESDDHQSTMKVIDLVSDSDDDGGGGNEGINATAITITTLTDQI